MATVFQKIMGYFSQDIGIDLGTANTLVCLVGRGIVLNEPSFVAVLKKTKKAYRDKNGQVAVGEKAKDMLSKVHDAIEVVRPLKEGVISDFEITEIMLNYFIQKVSGGRKWGLHPRMIIAVPAGITPVETRAVIEAASRAGARETYLIQEPMAAGIGAGLPVQEPTGSMVVDIGGGTTEVAVLALAGIVEAQSLRVAGDKFNLAIIQYVQNKHQFLIGENWAEKIKILIGSAWPLERELSMIIKGRDLQNQRPAQITLNSVEVREALSAPIAQIIRAVKTTLERTPPELCADLVDTGITLAGGGALLRGLDRALADATHLPVFVAESPLECVARGTGAALENIDLFAQIAQAAEAA